MIALGTIVLRIPHQDQRDAVMRLDADGDALLAQLRAMTPHEPEARNTIRAVFEVLHQLSTITGVCPADLYAARLQLHRESLRLTGEGRPPHWSPDPSATPPMKHV